MKLELNEKELVQKSIAYLKSHYGEDTVRVSRTAAVFWKWIAR